MLRLQSAGPAARRAAIRPMADARQQAVQAYIAKIKEHRDAEANIKKVREQHIALEKEFAEPD